MSRHFDKAEGASEEIDIETQSYVFNQTMLRIKDPKKNTKFLLKADGNEASQKV